MLLENIDILRKEASQKLDQSMRSQLGQYMTPTVIAELMASIFQNKDFESIHLLDAGAGIGSLTAAFIEEWSKRKKPKQFISTTYEIDGVLLPYLKENLTTYQEKLRSKKIDFDFDINSIDFIKDASLFLVGGKKNHFTHAILNPPYKKIHSSSDHRKLLRLTHFETVNLYSAFVGLSLKLLKDKGELVAIIPRSFCNGNYYRAFRSLIIEQSAIKRIHLFESRTQAFKDDEVLQENIIIYLVKGEKQGDVKITVSQDAMLKEWTEFTTKFDKIVKPGDAEQFIHIPSNEINLIENSEAVSASLSDLSIQVSTGPVVDFRAKDYLLQNPTKDSVPLLYPVHFNGKEIDWPKVSKKPNAIAINKETSKMFYPNGFYVVVRRFSSKEEKQRIVARVINPNKLDCQHIGIENHLNVFHAGKKGIAEEMAYGLAAFLNSSYVDTHFRTFNGHTQVNATDLKQMKYPNMQILITLGKWAKKLESFDQSKIDKKLKEVL